MIELHIGLNDYYDNVEYFSFKVPIDWLEEHLKEDGVILLDWLEEYNSIDSKDVYEQAVLQGVIKENEAYEKALKELYDSDNDDWGWI